ncbi:DUF6161 domain-containing protein [Sphingomonas sp.]|uniref:DUF6161 domain-containing protein n=1 Tax=Sphingomonas sp. TaxID=28214 RepID=UPI0031D70361
MHRIVFAPDKGGIHQFDTLGEARFWVDNELVAFNELFAQVAAAQYLPEFNTMQREWARIARAVEPRPHEDSNSSQVVAGDAAMVASSPAAQVLHGIGEQLGDIALRGALYAADVPVKDLDWSRQETLAGIQLYQLEIAKYRRASNNPIPPELRGAVAEFRDELDNLRGRISSASADASKSAALASAGAKSTEEALQNIAQGVEKTSAELMASIRETEARLESMAAASQSELARHDSQAQTFVTETRKRVDDWIEAQTEAVRLTAPVELWAQRATNHQTATRTLGIIALVAGAIGTILTPFISWGAFDSAHWLLSDAVEKGSGKATQAVAAGIRQTLHFELIFTGTATLFWLTMFFWLMRIVVRRYSAEQRLAVDASGRAAMAQTYLGLIMESAAGETERPIVLEALFRPVVEAGRGEDGPPATSLASIVAAIVAGKSG